MLRVMPSIQTLGEQSQTLAAEMHCVERFLDAALGCNLLALEALAQTTFTSTSWENTQLKSTFERAMINNLHARTRILHDLAIETKIEQALASKTPTSVEHAIKLKEIGGKHIKTHQDALTDAQALLQKFAANYSDYASIINAAPIESFAQRNRLHAANALKHDDLDTLNLENAKILAALEFKYAVNVFDAAKLNIAYVAAQLSLQNPLKGLDAQTLPFITQAGTANIDATNTTLRRDARVALINKYSDGAPTPPRIVN